MIIDSLSDCQRYVCLHSLFAKAFTFLSQENLAGIPDGRHDIAGDKLYAVVVRDRGRKKKDGRLEYHQKYIDIQYVLSGVDTMGWKPASSCQDPAGAFDPEKDAGFYNDVPDIWIPVGPGRFAVFFPHDAHSPMISRGRLHKAIIKVKI